jgi:PAS domain-containing protein
MTPVLFGVSGAILGWGLFKYGLFDLTPIARAVVMESMSEGVVVVERRDRVVDLNRAAQAMPGRETSFAVGRSVYEVFSEWLCLFEEGKTLRREGTSSYRSSMATPPTRRA